jgi:hypothetical protein
MMIYTPPAFEFFPRIVVKNFILDSESAVSIPLTFVTKRQCVFGEDKTQLLHIIEEICMFQCVKPRRQCLPLVLPIPQASDSCFKPMSPRTSNVPLTRFVTVCGIFRPSEAQESHRPVGELEIGYIICVTSRPYCSIAVPPLLVLTWWEWSSICPAVQRFSEMPSGSVHVASAAFLIWRQAKQMFNIPWRVYRIQFLQLHSNLSKPYNTIQ